MYASGRIWRSFAGGVLSPWRVLERERGLNRLWSEVLEVWCESMLSMARQFVNAGSAAHVSCCVRTSLASPIWQTLGPGKSCVLRCTIQWWICGSLIADSSLTVRSCSCWCALRAGWLERGLRLSVCFFELVLSMAFHHSRSAAGCLRVVAAGVPCIFELALSMAIHQ